jgi:hypothetical protein
MTVHEPMGIHAPQWCATCSKGIESMTQWVEWPCLPYQLAQAQARSHALAELLRRLMNTGVKISTAGVNGMARRQDLKKAS